MNILPVNKNTQAVIAVVTDYYIYIYIYTLKNILLLAELPSSPHYMLVSKYFPVIIVFFIRKLD